jgi:glycosyltransferase involved in cell wall biosynthesis
MLTRNKRIKADRSKINASNPRIAVLTGLHKPEYLTNVLRNYTNQVYRNKELILVLNGEAKGMPLPVNFPHGFVRWDGKAAPAEAKNIGLQFMRDRNFNGIVACLDADDFYAPFYLSEIAANANKADVFGKISYFTLVAQRLYVVNGIENAYHDICIGPSMAWWMDCTPKYGFPQPESGVGEDMSMLTGMLTSGCKLWCTSKFNMCYQRHGRDHTWNISNDDFLALNKGNISDMGNVSQEEFHRIITG